MPKTKNKTSYKLVMSDMKQSRNLLEVAGRSNNLTLQFKTHSLDSYNNSFQAILESKYDYWKEKFARVEGSKIWDNENLKGHSLILQFKVIDAGLVSPLGQFLARRRTKTKSVWRWQRDVFIRSLVSF